MNLLTILLWAHLINPSQIQFSTNSLTVDSNSGYMQLEWIGEGLVPTYILQQSENPNFKESKTIYEGPDQATFISGLDNGTYYYRVGDEQGNWSETLTLNVTHQSLSLAYTLFGLGLLVFACTVFIVIKGVKTSAPTS